jgi:hypothetical protein
LTVDACMYACMLILFLLAKTINETTTTTTTIAGAVPDSSAACDFMETRTEQNVIITRTKTNCAAVWVSIDFFVQQLLGKSLVVHHHLLVVDACMHADSVPTNKNNKWSSTTKNNNNIRYMQSCAHQ